MGADDRLRARDCSVDALQYDQVHWLCFLSMKLSDVFDVKDICEHYASNFLCLATIFSSISAYAAPSEIADSSLMRSTVLRPTFFLI